VGPYSRLLVLTTINLVLAVVALLLNAIIAGWLWLNEIGARQRTP
jgi:hypothetical protein